MTIAAGFHCSDGILICADSEQNDFIANYQREKIFVVEDWLMFTGAGTSDYIRMAFNKLHEQFRSKWPNDPFEARTKAEEMILDLHCKHIYQVYKGNGEFRPEVQIIFAVRCANGELALVKTVETSATLGDWYEAVGSGKYLFEYWISSFYHPEQNLNLLSHLCTLTLREVKKHVPGCGGVTWIMGLPKEAGKRPTPFQMDEQKVLGGFPQSAIPLIVECLNLQISDNDFEGKIEEFASLLRMSRQQERQIVNLNEITKHNLPLPGAPLGSEQATRILEASKQKLGILQTGPPKVNEKADDLISPSTEGSQASEE